MKSTIHKKAAPRDPPRKGEKRKMGIIERYRDFLPVTRETPVITLSEGNTPLIAAVHLPEFLGVDVKVFFKFEGSNPTGSFKDRGMTLAVSLGVGRGSQAIICASTGNT